MDDTKPKILIIDDEPSMRSLLRMHLEGMGLNVSEAVCGKDGVSRFSKESYQVVLLDLGLPDIDGMEVLKLLREISKNTPIIVITVRNQDFEKVQALDAGADDYIVKPFSLDEMKARIRAALRRSDTGSNTSTYLNGPLKIDFNSRQVFVNDEEVPLTQKEFLFLAVLAHRTGTMVTRGFILEQIWGENASENSHYLRIYLGHLRKKLKIENLITTQPGVGYRLNFI